MNLHREYNRIKERIDAIDFSALWEGFHPFRFALYNETECFFDGRYIEKTEEFHANTSIFYNGENIAIWKLTEEPTDIDSLAASIVHEMFHAFQNDCGEKRYPDERRALLEYHYSAENLSAKLQEAELMRAIIEGGEKKFTELLSVRKLRKHLFPRQYDYEARVEQIEGTANYVELLVLMQIAPEKGRLRLSKMLDDITNAGKYFPIRIISYSIGAVFLYCIKKCSSFVFSCSGERPFSDEILDDVHITSSEIIINPEIDMHLTAYNEETERIINTALNKGEICLKGNYPLACLNIWDARWSGKYAISNHFVAYFDGDRIKYLNGNFVVEIDNNLNILTVYRQ
ncbi:MAG: hypothetical protein GX494_03970 [Clostridiaceae bacterium]|nr:hypothetical protein [Clostridiaceae bacterium]